jgi:hypothetical protein
MNADERLPMEVLQGIFGKIAEESTSIVQSCCCQALLNENTGVYGCRLLEVECPFEILRKEKWQKSIEVVKSKIFDLKKKYRTQHRMTDEERQRNLLAFLDNFKSVTENSQRNELYRTIIKYCLLARERQYPNKNRL